ncbi:MAG: hypothetical protein K8U57_01855 [Planctomycetes bacterium]|nr:hypothetical protein [Planctomycetota bacterium]
MAASRKFRLGCELLGDRSLPSATLTSGLLDVVGTTGSDIIRVTLSSPTSIHVTVSGTGEDLTFDRSQVTSILIRPRAGDDVVVVGPSILTHAEVRGWSGNDNILGGGGDDTLLGGGGDDTVNGRGGNDTVVGQAGNDHLFGELGDDRLIGDAMADDGHGGNDDLHGGDGNDDLSGRSGNDHLFGELGDDRGNGELGDDSIDGGSGRDVGQGGGGTDNVTNAVNLDTQLSAVFTGGAGNASFKFGPEDGGVEREFEVEVEGLSPNATASVLVDGQSVGTIALDSVGAGKFKLGGSFDSGHNGNVAVPSGFPEVHVGSIVSVQLNGATVRQGTFVETAT